MTQAFNPFAQPAQNPATYVPAQAPAIGGAPPPVAAYAPPGPARGGLDDASNDGPGSPLMPHVGGNFRFRVVGYTTFIGHKSGAAVHISCEVLASTNEQIQPGAVYRFIYKYDFQNDRPAQGNVGLVHLRLLRQFWQAASRNPAASVLELHRKALTTDWSQVQVQVDAQCQVVPYTNTKVNPPVSEPRRNETWIAAQ